MNEVQQYLFTELAHPLSVAQEQLSKFRYTERVQKDFIRAVYSKATAAGPGGLVAVGCSPAVKQELIVADILRALWPHQGESESDHTQALSIVAPPEVIGIGRQLQELHERYRRDADALDVSYKHGPLFWAPTRPGRCSPAALMVRSTETEAITDLLISRGIKLVCVMISGERISDRIVSHLADIARRSRVTHILLGSRKVMLQIARHPSCGYSTKSVIQPVYNPGLKESRMEFFSIMKGYDALISKCSNLKLTDRAQLLMTRVGGDPCRLSQWLCEALCEAARLGAPKLEWVHLERTCPSESDLDAATEDLSAYLGWTRFRSLDEPVRSSPAQAGRPRQKPGVRNPVRDAVPPAA